MATGEAAWRSASPSTHEQVRAAVDDLRVISEIRLRVGPEKLHDHLDAVEIAERSGS
jgi:hypothetical protein